MGLVIFNGLSSEDMHAQVEAPPEYEVPERDYEVTHIPGRNGDVIIDKGSYKNIERKYKMALDATGDHGSYTEIVSNFIKWLHSASGYARLEDSYEPDYFRLAMYQENITVSNLFMEAGEVDVTFNCKPQRFLKSGEKPLTFKSSGKIINPTIFDSNPLVIVTGTGTGEIKIGDYGVTINDIATAIIIDSELKDAYSAELNRNSNISLSEFPVLKFGSNDVSFSGGVTSVTIIPRWWTL